MADDPWGPIDLAQWTTVPTMRDRLATESDVRAGRAVFHLQGVRSPEDAAPLPLRLPRLALLGDEHAGRSQVVVVIQGERSFDKLLIGYRPLQGGNGICTLEELTRVDASDPRVRAASATI